MVASSWNQHGLFQPSLIPSSLDGIRWASTAVHPPGRNSLCIPVENNLARVLDELALCKVAIHGAQSIGAVERVVISEHLFDRLGRGGGVV